MKNKAASGTKRESVGAELAAIGAKPAKKRGRPSKGKTASKASSPTETLPASFKEEFEVLKRRLAPIENVNERVSVLSQRISSLPASISKVLTAIRDDLQRFG